MEGPLTFANETWNPIGDDVAIGDHNRCGSLGLVGLNGTTSIDFCKHGDLTNWKSIMYDGNTLHMDGNCNYADVSGRTDGDARNAFYLQSFDMNDNPYPFNYIVRSRFDGKGDNRFYLQVINNNDDAHSYQSSVDYAYNAGYADSAVLSDRVGYGDVIYNQMHIRPLDNPIHSKAGSIYMQESVIDNKICVTVGIDGLAGVGVNHALTANTADSIAWNNISGKPITFPAASHSHDYLPIGGGTITGDIKISKKLYLNNWSITPENDQLLTIRPRETVYGIFHGVRDDTWTFCPTDDGHLTLGTAPHRWGQIFSSVSAISTSDRSLKKDITSISDKYIDFFLMLQPVTYRFIDGSSGRIHVGFISQDVETAMEQVGLSDLDFAGFCKDKVGDDYIYSLRYEEFIALNTAVLQRQQAKVTNLEQRLNVLEKCIR